VSQWKFYKRTPYEVGRISRGENLDGKVQRFSQQRWLHGVPIGYETTESAYDLSSDPAGT
jgi:hypothetical protein